MNATQPGLSEGVRKIVDEEFAALYTLRHGTYAQFSLEAFEKAAARIEAAVRAKKEEEIVERLIEQFEAGYERRVAEENDRTAQQTPAVLGDEGVRVKIEAKIANHIKKWGITHRRAESLRELIKFCISSQTEEAGKVGGGEFDEIILPLADKWYEMTHINPIVYMDGQKARDLARTVARAILAAHPPKRMTDQDCREIMVQARNNFVGDGLWTDYAVMQALLNLRNRYEGREG